MKTLVVIPTYNEKENIGRIVEETLGLGEPGLAVLIVDDNSPDGTGPAADALSAARPEQVFVMHRPGKQGLGSAYLQGFRWGLDRGFEALCEMDADGQHEPASLRGLIGAVANGADLAIGSRRIAGGRTEGWTASRDWMSRSAMGLTRWALDLKTNDVTAGFRCYRAAAAARLLEQPIVSNGYAFQEEATFYCERLGFRIVEIPITFRSRLFGASKLTPREVLKFFSTIFRLRRNWRKMRKSAK